MQSEQPEYTDEQPMHEKVGPVEQWFSLTVVAIGMRIEQDELRIGARMTTPAGIDQVLWRDG
jgi:hypothetical protein